MSQLIILTLLLGSIANTDQGKYNPVLDIGDAAPVWEELPGVDGELHSLADLAEASAVVVIFTCNSCPYAVDYEDRIIALQEEFKDKDVAVVAINVNKIEEDRLEAMTARAEQKGFSFPYLFDESQQIAVAYGAMYTPEFFVLDKDRKIAYMGAMDDSTKAEEVEARHVANALNAVLSGEEVPVEETIAIGCRIRMERRRRDRR